MTGRKLIISALRIAGAVGEGQQPTHGAFSDGLEALNLLLDSWSVDELLPYDMVQFDTGLLAGVPNYAINSGAAWDGDSICLGQQPSSGGLQSLTINGTLATSGAAEFDVPRPIIITSTADDSARSFTVVGANSYGDTISETISGPDTATVRGVLLFKTITSITIDDDAAGVLVIGTDYIINVRRPIMIVDAFVRDGDGLDEPVFPITRDRYIEVPDKDETGIPTKFQYRQSYPSGELFIHPVPSGGQSIAAGTTGSEYITNGDFSVGTSWTLDSQWAITGNALVRTPGQGDAILGEELITDGGFAADLSAWPTSGDQWAWSGGAAKRTPGTGDPILSGTELVSNGTFNTNLGSWLYSTYFEWKTGKAHLKPNISDNEYIEQNLVDGVDLINGDSYYVSCEVSNSYNTSWSLIIGGVVLATGASGSLSGTHTWATGEDTSVRLSIEVPGAGMGEGYVDNISTQKIVGYTSQGPDALTQTIAGLANGTTYRVVYTISGRTAGNLTLKVGGTSGTARTADGTYTEDVVAGADGTISFYAADGNFDGSVDDVSIKEITGYEVLGADNAKQLSADLVTTLTTGNTYRLTFDVSGLSAGTCVPSIGDTEGTTIDADGSYMMDILCGGGEDFILAASSDFAGTFDNISLVDLSDGLTGSVQYTLFIDCWLPFKHIIQSEIDNEINLPGAYLLALKWGLASELCPELGRGDANWISNRAKNYIDIIRRINTRMPSPTTLWPVIPMIDNQLAVNMG